MDPFTAIAILSAHLLCSAALFLLILRRLQAQLESLDWAAAAFCFGAAFLGRVAFGLGEHPEVDLGSDALMVLAALLFARGMTHLARRPWRITRVLGVAAGITAVHVGVSLLAGPVLRFVSINAVLGLLYLVLAFMACRPIVLRTCHAQQRLPLGICTVLVAVLGAASLTRSVHIAQNGMDVVYAGPAAAGYFALSSLVAVLLVFTLLWVLFEQLVGQLAELASLDALTRVFNRNGLQMALRRHFAARPPTPLTLLLVDLDHFKVVNDQFGHASGDALIRAVADTLAQACRASDFVARFGGEEFLIGCGTDQIVVAEQLAQRICARIAALRVPLPTGYTLTCTVSVGISSIVYSIADWEIASQQADEALYRAKANGRNGWFRFEPDASAGLTTAVAAS
jgi:diguanylate cyclase (GGDEF)-like protein